MRAKITAMSMAAIIAAVIGAGPSFGQGMSPAGSPPPAAAPAPSGGGAAMGGGGGGAPQNAGPRGGGIVGGGNFQGRGGVVGGGNRQAWRDGRNHRGGYHRGYRGGVYFGGGPGFGGPYAYDDGYYVEGPAAAGGDVAYCMRRFRSYDPGSGTYLGNDGYRHACP